MKFPLPVVFPSYFTNPHSFLGAVVTGLLLSVSWQSTGQAQGLAAAPLEVPVRWCVLEGSPTLTDPAGVKTRLHTRMADMNNFVYRPKADILFRSGLPVQQGGGGGGLAIPPARYPVIPDLNLVGNEGDVINSCPANPDPNTRCDGRPGDGGKEFNEVINRCRLAWLTQLGTIVNGVTAVQIRSFVTKDGDATGWVGFGYSAPFGSRTLLKDDSLIFSDPQDKWASHEFGHTLSLPHGDGLDNDNDGTFDEKDENEGDNLNCPTCDNLMQYEKPSDLSSMFGTKLTQAQVDKMRAFVPLVNGLPETILPGAPEMLANGAPDELDDGLLDIDDFGIEQNPAASEVRYVVGFPTPLPDSVEFKVVFLVDADNDDTGGDPAQFLTDANHVSSTAGATTGSFLSSGPPTGGVDLVVIVEVDKNDGDVVLITRVFAFTSGGFEEVFDPGIGSALETGVLEGDHGEPVLSGDRFAVDFDQYSRVKVKMPSSLSPLESKVGLEVHVIPIEPGGRRDDTARVLLSFEKPVFPECRPFPARAAPGDLVWVKAKGLPSDQPTVVILGGGEVALGMTDFTGKDLRRFRVPLDIIPGEQEVSVEIDDLEIANQAVCGIDVFDCDVNGDERVTHRDLWSILGGIDWRHHFGRAGIADDPRDVNGDGRTTFKDFKICARVVHRLHAAKRSHGLF